MSIWTCLDFRAIWTLYDIPSSRLPTKIEGTPHTSQPLCNSDTKEGGERVSESQRSSCMRMALISFKIYLKFPQKFLTILLTSHHQKFPQNLNINTTSTGLMQPPQFVRLPSRLYTRLWYPFKCESHRRWLVCKAPSTYAESWEEGMSYQVRISLWLRYPSGSKLCRGWLVFGVPNTYVGSREEGISYHVRIARISSRVWMVKLKNKINIRASCIVSRFKPGLRFT